MSKLCVFTHWALFSLSPSSRSFSVDLLLALAGGKVGTEAIRDDAGRQEVAEEARVLGVQELLGEIRLLLGKTPEQLCRKVWGRSKTRTSKYSTRKCSFNSSSSVNGVIRKYLQNSGYSG